MKQVAKIRAEIEEQHEREMREIRENALMMNEAEPEFIFDNWFYVLTMRVKCRYFNSKRKKERPALCSFSVILGPK